MRLSKLIYFRFIHPSQMNPQKLYAANRIKVRGNLDKALKVERIISHEREKILLAGQVRQTDFEHSFFLLVYVY
jgi:hypothetical protein